MVLTAARTRLVPSLVLPDEQSWTVWGRDPATVGLRPVFDPGMARRAIAPEQVPAALAEPVRSLLLSAGAAAAAETLPSPMRGAAVERLQDGEHRGHGEHEGHGGHDEHDHGDMMAIEGEPSADGLVMEPIEFQLGPLGPPLPAGLVADVTLDGDVVAEATVRALLEGTPAQPDLLAPAAWQAAIDAEQKPETEPAEQWRQVVAVERERAVSHLAWLRAFGRLLGWEPLVERCSQALAAEPAQSAAAAVAVLRLVESSTRLASRTRGRATLDADHVLRRGLRGPLARAAGIPDDARMLDPRYRSLGFEPLVENDGDALARTLLRAREAVQALDLAATAERLAADGARPDSATTPVEGALVEGPRGPLHAERVDGGLRLTAPGSVATRAAAGDAMVGEEWSAALVALASFDLSPWQVAG